MARIELVSWLRK